MEFLTEKQVAAEAEKGKLPAMECSLLHHEQGRDAGKVELIKAVGDDTFDPTSIEECACCVGYTGKECPFSGNIFDCGTGCCEGNYGPVRDAWKKFQADYSNANFRAFQDTEANLCMYIEGKIAEEKKKLSTSCLDCCHSTFTKPCESCKDRSNWESKAEKPTPKPRPLSKDGDYSLRVGCSTHIYQGNIFADLKRNSEELRRFNKMKFHYDPHVTDTTIKAYLGYNCVNIVLRDHVGGNAVGEPSIEQAEEFHQKLGQLIATAKK